MSWSREHVRVLINEYKRYPCLFAVKSKSYMNKHAKNAALNNILGVLQKIRHGVTINEIKTKYAGLKATFLTEYKKHKDSLGTGKGADEIYYPTLWYFDDFAFILDHCEPRTAVDSLDGDIAASEENESQIEIEEYNELNDCPSDPTEMYIVNAQTGCLEVYNKETVDDNLRSDDECSSSSRPASSLSSTPRGSIHGPQPGTSIAKRTRGTKRQMDDTAQILKHATSSLQTLTASITQNKRASTSGGANTDDDSILAQFITSKLKQIKDPLIRIETEEGIAKLLYESIKKCEQKRNTNNV